MTYSATPSSREGFQAVRARLVFTMRDEPVRPAPAGKSRAGRWWAMAGAVAVCAGVVLWFGMEVRPAAPAPAVAPVVPVAATPAAPAWIEVIHPFMAYDLAGGPFARLPLTYAARRDAGGTARQDTLTYGPPVPGEAFLRLMFYRRGAEPATPTTVFVDAARLAAGAGLAVTRSGLASTLATRFGPVEAAGMAVAGRERSADCLAFRLADPVSIAVLQIVGLACGTAEKPIDPASLACTIEKVDLVSAGDDEDLRALFVAAERRRGVGCHDLHRATLLGDEPPMRHALKGLL